MTAYDQGSGYWDYQSRIGEIGGVLNRDVFQPYIAETDTVLDFGCGGGFLLDALRAGEKIGVEIGPEAAAHARSLGLTVHSTTSKVPSDSVDVVISSHTLEHTHRPLDELTELRRVLKPGGRLVLRVPIDDWRSGRKAQRSDLNHHLYTWTPLLLGNLLQEAGFEVEECRVVTQAWRPGFLALNKRSESAYRFACWIVAMLQRRRQIHAVAS